ncbi:hypothetical protein SNEBB_010880 [Seison nebaliae]|nr:hypothetical protein SNEBB_010880 [Seison nebaliae]
MIKRYRFVVALSGGVDSSVACWIVKNELRKNESMLAIHMNNWNKESENGLSCSEGKVQEERARFLANELNISFLKIDLSRQYWNDVFKYLLDQYYIGHTPNPDIVCNEKIKFAALFHELERRKITFDQFATGHYARIVHNRYLATSIDNEKDQTFFLSRIHPKLFPKITFPLGNYNLFKSQVKAIATEMKWNDITSQKESMGLCFVGKRRKFHNFLRKYLPEKTCQIIDVDKNGKNLEESKNLYESTLGQKIIVNDQRFYVWKKEDDTKKIYVIRNGNDSRLYNSTIILHKLQWLIHPNQLNEHCSSDDVNLSELFDINERNPSMFSYFRYQHQHRPIICQLRLIGKDEIELESSIFLRCLCEGQFGVLYCLKGEICLANGEIKELRNSLTEIDGFRNRPSPFHSDQLLNKQLTS